MSTANDGTCSRSARRWRVPLSGEVLAAWALVAAIACDAARGGGAREERAAARSAPPRGADGAAVPPPLPSGPPPADGGGRPRAEVPAGAAQRGLAGALRGPGARRLALTPERVAWLGPRTLEVRGLDAPGHRLSFDLDEPRALVALAGGVLLAVGGRGSLRLLPHDAEVQRLPRLSLLPGQELLPEPSNPRGFWVVGAAPPELLRYAPGPSSAPWLLPVATLPLPGFDRRAVALAADGAAVFTTPRGLAVAPAPGGSAALDVPATAPQVLRAAGRPDEIWLLVGDRELIRVRRLGGRGVPVERRLATRPVVDVATSGPALAALSVDPGGGGWSVELWPRPGGGPRRLAGALAREPAPEQLAAAEVALVHDPPRVAVWVSGAPALVDVQKGEPIPLVP